MARTLHTVSAIAAELRRDRRTVGDALRNVHPDGEVQGRPAWHIMSAFRALYGEKVGPRERKQVAEAELFELDLAKKRGAVVDVETVAKDDERRYGIVRERLLNIPGKLTGVLDPDQADRLREEITDALEELSAPSRRASAAVAEAAPAPARKAPSAASVPRNPARKGRL